jgi:uncharacterized protein involved in type VI secretion and phage assembly
MVNDQVEQTTKKQDDVVAYSTYSKVMGTLKKRESELNEVRTRLEAIELEKKQAEGNKDEVITTLRDKLKHTEEAQNKLKHQYAWTTLEGQIKTAALQQGCVNPDKLVQLLSDDDLKAIEVDESFKVNQDDLNRLLEKAKKDHSDIRLFKTKSVNVNDVAPVVPKTKNKTVEEMSASELKEYLLKN